MPPDVEFSIGAVDESTQILKQINDRLKELNQSTDVLVNQSVKVKNATQKATEGTRDWSNAIIVLNQGMQAAGQIYRAVNQVINQTVGEFVKYADQVRTVTQLTGQSSEKSSRLIQVLDDYKISIDSVNSANATFIRNGMTMTTETLAGLSDKYNQLNTIQEKNTFMVQNFGRDYQKFLSIMEAGGNAIRNQSASISQNLILTSQSIKAAHDWEVALDDFNDTVQGTKVNLGQQLLPAVKVGIEYFNRSITLTERQDHALILLRDAYNDGRISVDQYNEALKKLEITGYDVAASVETIDKGERDFIATTQEAAKAIAEADFEQGFSATEDAGKRLAMQFDLLKSGLTDLGEAGASIWNAFLQTSGMIDAPAISAFVRIQMAIAKVKELLAAGASFRIIVSYLQGTVGPNADVEPSQQRYSFGAAETGWTGVIDKVTGKRQYKDPDGTFSYRAGGGAFSGWAMVGDAAGGNKTPYTEYVYAPHGAMVYNQSQMSGQSAPPMSSGGFIPPMANEVTLSDKSIRDIALALAYEMAK